MDDELNTRLAALDPAGATPAELEPALVAIAARARGARKRRWRKAAAIGGSVMVAAAVAAGANLDSYLLSSPPFQTLDEGTVRTTEGVPYSEAGESGTMDCLLFAELAGVTREQFAAADAAWSAIDPEEFASGIMARHGTGVHSPTIQQAIEELDPAVPGITWLDEGGPQLHALAASCEPAG